jgi:carbon storage regulator CsrA
MLVLTRKIQEAVVVGGSGTVPPMLTITVLEIDCGKVRLGFQAEAAVVIHRWEVWQRIQADGLPDGSTPDPAAPGSG